MTVLPVEEQLERSRAIAVESRRYDEERESGLLARNAAMREVRDRLFAAESCKAYLIDRIAQLQSPTYKAGPGEPDRDPTILEAFLAQMEFIDCSKPFVYGLIGEPYVEPGMFVIVVGCSFGTRQGELRLVTNAHGGHFKLDVIDWREDVVYAQMPPYEEMSGLVDHDWHLQVVASGPPPTLGARSNLREVKFRAERAIVPVFGVYSRFSHSANHWAGFDHMGVPVLVCDNPATPTGPKTYRVTRSVTGLHRVDSDAGPPRTGTDHWRVDLINGWVSHHVSPVERIHQAGTGTYIGDPRLNAPGTSTLHAEVDWEVHNESFFYFGNLEYALLLWVEGPKDTPYATEFDPVWNLAPGSISLPGEPCSAP